MKENALIVYATRNPNNVAILERLPGLGIPDAWLVAGAIFQTVWNCLTDRRPDYGIRDYDLFYYDASDLSWAAEDRVIRRAAEAFSDLEVDIEVRNQARVHLWYEQHYGLPYTELTSACEGIDRFLAPACMVGLHPDDPGEIELYAPLGLEDLGNLTIRPNLSENFSADHYEAKARRWKKAWPELTIVPAEVE